MKSNPLKTLVILTVITVFMSNSLFGQPRNNSDRKKPPTFAQLLKDMDSNEDGKLSKKEIKGPLKEVFAEVDTNEDGFITEEEFKKAPKPKRRDRN
ncbi:EF-hand domain-containing protein [Psychroserpens sp.]|uniref:EF-hand domain-containing protein n=1 Tax=Psychroserpens sp. TaxID=2020870 RepID=UPI003858B7AD